MYFLLKFIFKIFRFGHSLTMSIFYFVCQEFSKNLHFLVLDHYAVGNLYVFKICYHNFFLEIYEILV